MRRQRFQLVKTSCKRYGKPLMTGNRSLHGADEAKARLGSICERCATDEERREMLDAQASAILGHKVTTAS